MKSLLPILALALGELVLAQSPQYAQPQSGAPQQVNPQPLSPQPAATPPGATGAIDPWNSNTRMFNGSFVSPTASPVLSSPTASPSPTQALPPTWPTP